MFFLFIRKIIVFLFFMLIAFGFSGIFLTDYVSASSKNPNVFPNISINLQDFYQVPFFSLKYIESLSNVAQMKNFIESGGKIVLDNHFSGTEILQIIKICEKESSNITIFTKRFRASEIETIIKSGANVIIDDSSPYASYLTDYVKLGKNRVTIFCAKSNIKNTKEFLNLGSRVVVNNRLSCKDILKLIDEFRGQVEVDCRNFDVNYVIQLIKRGGRVRIGDTFSEKDIQKLTTVGNDKVTFICSSWKYETLVKITQSNSKIILFNFKNISSKSNKINKIGQISKENLKTAEILSLVKVAQRRDNVNIVCNGFEPSDISDFLASGANVILEGNPAELGSFRFIGLKQSNDNITQIMENNQEKTENIFLILLVTMGIIFIIFLIIIFKLLQNNRRAYEIEHHT